MKSDLEDPAEMVQSPNANRKPDPKDERNLPKSYLPQIGAIVD